MAIISKPHGDFEADTVAESAKVNDQINTIYNDHNGNVADANIAPGANIQQSKILNLQTDFATLTNRKGYEGVGIINAVSEPYVEFVGLGLALYDQYLLTINNLKCSIEDTDIYLVFRAGSFGYLTAGNDYSYSVILNRHDSPTPTGLGSTGVGAIPLTSGVNNMSSALGRTTNGEVKIFALSQAVQKTILYDFIYFDTSGNVSQVRGNGVVRSTSSSMDGIRIVPLNNVGVMWGQFALYGLRKQ